jgi:hypothetical protein
MFIGPNAGWWVLTTANAAGTNGLTCLPKHEIYLQKRLETDDPEVALDLPLLK